LMIRKWFSICLLIAAAVSVLAVSSCGDPQELVSITIQPGTETFGASNVPVSELAGAQVQLRALGTYVHPPVTKDITDQVTWVSNTPQMVTVSSTGLITVTGGPCGGTLISATVQTNADASGVSASGAVVTGYMTADVTCFTGTSSSGGSGSGGAEPAISVTFAGTGSGTVTSSPLGLSCASTATLCSAAFATGTNVTLTATPFGTFGGWQGCGSVSGDTCTIDNLSSDVSVTATFN
jgi:Bacterial Ig-like domain (group 2)